MPTVFTISRYATIFTPLPLCRYMLYLRCLRRRRLPGHYALHAITMLTIFTLDAIISRAPLSCCAMRIRVSLAAAVIAITLLIRRYDDDSEEMTLKRVRAPHTDATLSAITRMLDYIEGLHVCHASLRH